MINYAKIKYTNREWLEEQAAAFNDAVDELIVSPTIAFKEEVEEETGLDYADAWELEESLVTKMAEQYIEREANRY